MTDRWKEYRGFVAKWFPPIREGEGVLPSALVKAEERLGFLLPTAVREFYLLAGNREDLIRRYNQLIPLSKLKLVDGMLAVWEENQGVYSRVILTDHLKEENPKVFMFIDGSITTYDNDENWEYFTDICLLETARNLLEGDYSTIGSAGNAWDGEAKPDVVEQIRLRISPPPEPILAQYGYELADGIIGLFGDGFIQIGAGSEGGLLFALNAMKGISWDHISIDVDVMK
jgi:hypothetical protein